MEGTIGQQNNAVFNVSDSQIDNTVRFYPTVWREELTLIKLRDRAATVYLDGNKLTANSGDIIIARPFALHSVCPESDGDAPTLTVVTINLRALSTANVGARNFGALIPFFHEKNVPYRITSADDGYLELNDRLSALSRVTDDEAIQETVYALLKALYERRLPPQKHNMSAEKQHFAARKTIAYISCTSAQPITIEMLTEISGYSEFYLMKLFKQYTGISCIDYVNGYRIKEASRLLTETKTDANEIARAVGYANISYFNRQFKRLTGVTPLVLRLTSRK